MSPHIPSVFTTLAVSALLVSYILYGAVTIPSGIEQADQMVWLFAKAKYTRALCELGSYFGLGHRVELYRSIHQFLSPPTQTNYKALQVSNETFDGVSVRVYGPDRREGLVPGVILVHGGGWVFGSVDRVDQLATTFVRRLGVVVVSINYRLAPEHPYPVPFDDCLAATTFFLKNAADYGADSGRVALLGVSAGANLAAAVSLKLSRRADEASSPAALRPELQVLIVPCLQAVDFNTPSYQENEFDSFMPKYIMTSMWLWYARGPDGHLLLDNVYTNEHTSAAAKQSVVSKYIDHALLGQHNIASSYVPNDVNFGNETLWRELQATFSDPYFAPLMAPDLAGVPETYIATAQHDVLRDDGILFAKRLRAAGVDVKHAHYDKAFHGTWVLPEQLQTAKKMLNDVIDYLAVKL